MRKNFSGNILDLDGFELTEPVLNQKDGTESRVPIPVRRICVNALLAADEKRSGEEQLKRYKLARKINAGGVVEVTAEEVVMIKAAVAAAFAPIVTGFIEERLEQDAPPAEE